MLHSEPIVLPAGYQFFYLIYSCLDLQEQSARLYFQFSRVLSMSVYGNGSCNFSSPKKSQIQKNILMLFIQNPVQNAIQTLKSPIFKSAENVMRSE